MFSSLSLEVSSQGVTLFTLMTQETVVRYGLVASVSRPSLVRRDGSVPRKTVVKQLYVSLFSTLRKQRYKRENAP